MSNLHKILGEKKGENLSGISYVSGLFLIETAEYWDPQYSTSYVINILVGLSASKMPSSHASSKGVLFQDLGNLLVLLI